MRSVLPLLVAACFACGPGTPEPMEGTLGRGGSCAVQAECFDCEGCRLRYNEVCVEGACWLAGDADPAAPDGDPLFGSFNVQIELDRGMDVQAVRSAAIRVLHPRRADGHPVTCADLLSDALGSDDDTALNLLRTLNPATPALSPGDGLVTMGANRIPAGPDRVFLVRLHRQSGGGGDVLAVGCTEAVPVVEGAGQTVVVETALP